ncbi:MAG TPA: MmcQ/YjbR family DNA-binding protein [Actinomycetota bacterium]|nr:MmcQ/YjbR family DNA-binding protein [Actinomycetota bacterium]
MRLEEARRFALSLPGTNEQAHFEKTSFRVGGKIFATAPPGGGHLHVFVDEDEVRASVADDPSTFEELHWGKKLAGVRIDLRSADRDTVLELLEESWRRRAPKRLIAELDSRG